MPSWSQAKVPREWIENGGIEVFLDRDGFQRIAFEQNIRGEVNRCAFNAALFHQSGRWGFQMGEIFKNLQIMLAIEMAMTRLFQIAEFSSWLLQILVQNKTVWVEAVRHKIYGQLLVYAGYNPPITQPIMPIMSPKLIPLNQFMLQIVETLDYTFILFGAQLKWCKAFYSPRWKIHCSLFIAGAIVADKERIQCCFVPWKGYNCLESGLASQ